MANAPVVMKFGGTSVQDPEAVGRLIEIVRAARQAATAAGRSGPLVVVSALSKVTDALLAVAERAAAGALADAERDISTLRARHQAMLELVRDTSRRATLEAAIDRQFDELASLARALDVLGEVSPRSRDAIASIGELVSSRLVAQALTDGGVPADWVDARQVLVTNDTFGAAIPDGPETAARVYRHVEPVLAEGRVAVIGGYVGGTRAGVATTLGRGGSDYSAALFGAAIGAVEIQIWTDVDGMLTGDPRLVARPRVVDRLSFDEASELAYFGAKVLHPSTILPAVARDIPVRILNARNPSHPGTRIQAAGDPDATGPVAFACKRGVTRIDISSTRMLMAHGFLQRVFEVFARHRTSVDVVTTSEVSVSVTIDDERRLAEIRAALAEFADVACVSARAIVCAVGERMAIEPGLGTRVIGALDGLPIEMISLGGSRKNVTVVVPDACVADAMTRLHARFFEGDA